jgi:uroporphyrinogen decarboxylase
MNSKERILTALQGEQPDRVPIFELYINEAPIVTLAKLLASEEIGVKAGKDRFGEERPEILDLYCFVVQALELDATCWNFSIGLKVIGEDLGRDKFGTVYRLSEHGEPIPLKGPIQDSSDLVGFNMVSKLEPDDFTGIQQVIENVGKDKAHFISIQDPFKVSWRRRGSMQNLLMDYILNPQLVHDLARIATDFDMAVIDTALQIGVDVIIVPGDLAGEQTTIMSPQHYREYIKPYHKELVDYAHR